MRCPSRVSQAAAAAPAGPPPATTTSQSNGWRSLRGAVPAADAMAPKYATNLRRFHNCGDADASGLRISPIGTWHFGTDFPAHDDLNWKTHTSDVIRHP